MIKGMPLETKRLIIRPYIEDDLMPCFHLMQDRDLYTYMDMQVMSIDEFKRLFNWLINSYTVGFNEDFKYSFNVTLKETSTHIGWVGIGGVDYDHSIKEIFWLIGRKYWNNGYASEAASALLEYGFRVININEIIALCKPENIASKRVMEHIGLKYRGMIENLPVEHNFYNGELMYSLMKDEYQCIK